MQDTPRQGGAVRWIALTVLVLPVVLVSMDLSVLYLAIPTISRDLEPSSSQMLWILDSYAFVLASLLIVMGNVGDRIGRRRLLLIGATLFGVASTVAAFAPTTEVLIGARAAMGVGGATLMPSTLALIRNIFDDPGERTRAIGIWTAAFAGGGALGPVVGGVLLDFFSWGSVFLINVPVIAVLLILARPLVPEYASPVNSRFDIVGALLLLGTILSVVYAMKHSAEIIGLDQSSIVALLLGLGLGITFVLQQRRTAAPLVDTGLLRNPIFLAGLVAVTVGMLALMGPNLFFAWYLQLVLGMGPLVAALWLLPMTFTAAIGATTAPKLLKTVGLARSLAIGFMISALSLVIVAFSRATDGVWILLVGGMLLGLGATIVLTLATESMVSAAPASRAGAASAISETGSELGGALGIAVLGSVGTAIYRASVDVPSGVPTEVADAARETLAGAAQMAGELPAEIGAALLDNARTAFAFGFSIAAVSAAVIMLALAIVVPRMLARQRSTTSPDEVPMTPAP
ncbi:MFS transporter [Micromonospora andamanensis]|uniref:MFS transporter n=1 Tax=Micromonospora andamanensis TaxID=1287068 RepID=UPI00194F66BC|nr:MFS transporter [Micromonospora andamanensis]GIJ41667.1 MFS transporter [Micromonospora andamanensis]